MMELLSDKKVRIVLIAGTWYNHNRYERTWDNVSKALKVVFPEATFFREYKYYQPWQLNVIHSLGEEIIEKHDTGDIVILVGHSMGGITACGIADRFKKSNVIGVITIFTPHTLGQLFHFLDFKHLLGYPDDTPNEIPVLSFGGMFDPLVWQPFTQHPRSITHHLLLSDHFFLLGRSPRVAAKITKHVRAFFSRGTQQDPNA